MSDAATSLLLVLSFFCFLAMVLYRLVAGKFLLPKREFVLPNQNGVLVKGEQFVRVLKPGSHWVRPKERILLCDMRPRNLEISNFEVFTSDEAIVRLNVSAEYKVSDPIVYLASSASAVDALASQFRRAIVTSARVLDSVTTLSAMEVLGKKLAEVMQEPASKLGFTISAIQVWDVYVARQSNAITSSITQSLIH